MFKPELVLPPMISGVLLCAWILYLIRRLGRDLKRQSAESNAKAQAQHEQSMANMAKTNAELALLEYENAAHSLARAVERLAQTVAEFGLVLTLDAGADADEVFGRVAEYISGLSEYAQASGGAGLKLDSEQSRAEPGTLTLRLIPTDPKHAIKQREVVEAKVRKLAGVSGVELVTAPSRSAANVPDTELVAA